MQTFDKLKDENDLSKVIKSAFDLELSISGGWGYHKNEPTVIHDLKDVPLKQFEHTLASMRAYGEMNMILPESERYSSINVNELSRESVEKDQMFLDKVTYEVSAMKESDYARFIEAYKKGYGNDLFDMEDHFRRRKKATLKRVVVYWFNVSEVK